MSFLLGGFRRHRRLRELPARVPQVALQDGQGSRRLSRVERLRPGF